MTDETPTIEITPPEVKQGSFSKRLRTAREAMGWERKDVARQLHLNEKIIMMMESDRYPADLCTTFIRGYLRSYGKLLQIPDYEIRQAIEPIKPVIPAVSPVTLSIPLESTNYLMQAFTYLILLTLIGLVAVWWHTHSLSPLANLTKNMPQTHSPQTVPAQTTDNPFTQTTTVQTTPPVAPDTNTATSQPNDSKSSEMPGMMTAPASESAAAPVQAPSSIKENTAMNAAPSTPSAAAPAAPAATEKAASSNADADDDDYDDE
jgi:cytoskeleton protein RodZ